jgi:hypothetical protein
MFSRLILASLVFLTSQAFAKDTTPWFGSEASAPSQIVFDEATSQLIDPESVSSSATSTAEPPHCPIEGCIDVKNLGKQPQ